MSLPDLYVSPVATSVERWLASYPARTAETYRESLLLAVRVMSDARRHTIHDVDWATFDDAHLAALREHLGSDMERSRCDNERCPRRPNGEG